MLVALALALVMIASGSRLALGQGADATPPAEIVPPDNAPYLELTFEELNDSGVTGTARLYDDGDQTIVVLAVQGAGANHPAHIHAGTCDDIEPEPAYSLANVESDGASSTRIDASLEELMGAPYVIDLHLAPSELGTLIDCAEITGEITPAAGTGATGTPVPAEPTETPTPTTTPEPAETPEPTATTEPTQTPEPTATTEPTETPAPTADAEPMGTPAANDDSGANTSGTEDVQDGTGGAVVMSEDTASLPLEGDADLEVTGTVVLNKVDDNTTLVSIVLSASGLTGDHPAHIHDGTCDNPGDEVIDLNPIDDSGISETEVDLSLDELTTDGYFVNVHNSEADYDTWLACGDLDDATLGAVVPEVAPETGGNDQSGQATRTPAPTAVPTPSTPGDGTSGDLADSGKGEPVPRASDLPSQAGTGSGLPRPFDPFGFAIWISAVFAVMLAGTGFWIRSHRTEAPSRWQRLGL